LSSFTIRRAYAATIAVSIASFLLGGCSGSSLEGFAFGKASETKVDPNLFPADYKQELAAFMRTYLDNPRRVRDAYIGTPVLRPVTGGAPRYVTCVRFNPLSPENKYQGNKEGLVIFHAGKVTQFVESDPQVCGGLAYQRYPEIESMVP
jgi:hypothetical protein